MVQVRENLFLPLTPSRRYAQSILRGGQLCQLLCPDSPIAIMRHDVTKPDSGILPKLMIALNGLARSMAEIPGRTATNRNSNAFEDVQSLWSIVSAYRHATPIPIRQCIETHFCIDNCIIYKTVVSRSPIFTSKLFRVYNVQFITILRHFLKIFILFLNYWNSFSNFSNS